MIWQVICQQMGLKIHDSRMSRILRQNFTNHMWGDIRTINYCMNVAVQQKSLSSLTFGVTDNSTLSLDSGLHIIVTINRSQLLVTIRLHSWCPTFYPILILTSEKYDVNPIVSPTCSLQPIVQYSKYIVLDYGINNDNILWILCVKVSWMWGVFVKLQNMLCVIFWKLTIWLKSNQLSTSF